LKETSRLDAALVTRGLAVSRERARALILAGLVRVNGTMVSKAGSPVEPGDDITLIEPDHPYVGRGGVKLAHALDVFAIDVTGRLALDVGASTGGFTDCLLQRGAARVYAIDVGTGQLDPRMRADQRVVVMEHTNARALDPRVFGDQPTLAVIDVSFISLEKILPSVFGVLAPRGEVIALVKPQFEVGREHVAKGGVVRDPVQHRAAVQRLARYAVLRGWHVLGVTASPLRGPKGNHEFFLHFSTHGRTASDLESLISRSVEALA